MVENINVQMAETRIAAIMPLYCNKKNRGIEIHKPTNEPHIVALAKKTI